MFTIHQSLSSYLLHPRRRAAQSRTNCEVRAVIIQGGRCRGVITNSRKSPRAGWSTRQEHGPARSRGWRAGTAPIMLEPRRRTIVTFVPPEQIHVSRWPFVISELDQLYAPVSGGLLLTRSTWNPWGPARRNLPMW
jgi:hypothetical protein